MTHWDWHIAVRNKRVASKLASFFNARSYETKIMAIGTERLDDRHTKDIGRYMVFVANPGFETKAFQGMCQTRYETFVMLNK